jgi:membrane protein implicated in regulation of membrane protease activity
MLTVFLILAVAALIITLLSAATGKVPLWVAVLLLAIMMCLQAIPWKEARGAPRSESNAERK